MKACNGFLILLRFINRFEVIYSGSIFGKNTDTGALSKWVSFGCSGFCLCHQLDAVHLGRPFLWLFSSRLKQPELW